MIERLMDGNAVKDEDDIENVEMAQIVQKENTIFSDNAKQKRENGAEPYILHRNAVSVLSSKCYDYSIVAIHHAIRMLITGVTHFLKMILELEKMSKLN